MAFAELPEPGIHDADAVDGINAWAPPEVGCGGDGGDDDLDVVGSGDLGHGAEVVFDHGVGFRSGVSSDVVGSS